MKKFDVVSIGNATLDVFISVHAKKTRDNCIILPCGSKQEVESIFYSTGGGATNTSVAFSRLGLRTGILAAVGKDDPAKTILSELKGEGVDTSMVERIEKFNTAYSAIVTGRGFDRVIFTYGGATTHLQEEKQINWRKLSKSNWFYVSSFHSRHLILEKVFDFARKNKINVAWNPGKSELKQGINKLRPILGCTNIFFVNAEEAEMLTRKKGIKANLRELQKLVPLVVITTGKKGCIAFDGVRFFEAKTHKINVVDSTGAGDAFNSGFLTGIIWGKPIPGALKLGVRVAESILVAMGAKNNLLSKKQVRKFV